MVGITATVKSFKLGLGQISKFTFEHSLINVRTFEASVLAFKLQVFLYIRTSFLSVILLNLFNKFVSIWKVHSTSTE